MDNIDILIQTLEPEIDAKCAEIKQRKSELLLTKIFVILAALMLILPAMLIFFGVSLFNVFVPIIFAGTLLLAMSPILIRKGAEYYEQV